MRALGWDVLGEFGNKIQGRQDLEVAFCTRGDPVAVVVGEGPARLLLGLIDGLASVDSPVLEWDTFHTDRPSRGGR